MKLKSKNHTTVIYTEKEVDDLLAKQRKICSDKIDDACRYNKINLIGHIAEYAPRP